MRALRSFLNSYPFPVAYLLSGAYTEAGSGCSIRRNRTTGPCGGENGSIGRDGYADTIEGQDRDGGNQGLRSATKRDSEELPPFFLPGQPCAPAVRFGGLLGAGRKRLSECAGPGARLQEIPGSPELVLPLGKYPRDRFVFAHHGQEELYPGLPDGGALPGWHVLRGRRRDRRILRIHGNPVQLGAKRPGAGDGQGSDPRLSAVLLRRAEIHRAQPVQHGGVGHGIQHGAGLAIAGGR